MLQNFLDAKIQENLQHFSFPQIVLLSDNEEIVES